MSYQVLARKWRPRSFATLVGQEHVVRALSHALETGRLHHARLFTGTRGVGKTTISRILAKALNCESGVSPEPCGQCPACVAIDADRFPDYVEMDAASNRGVDDMATLLDQAAYAPVQGRYKVYMIDEVHMLTGHAFNAMLKTLEEPPEHVKFILATTDPQKIPVTVLSRCLQFNLKQMPHGHIIEHLGRVLEAERIPFEAAALRHIAKAASGSMRDALSLLDQAIAHGAGQIAQEQVTLMLGTVGDDHLYAVLDALIAADVDGLLAVADDMAARSLSFDAALQALASLLHRIALVQFAPTTVDDETERVRLQHYATAFDAEFLQLAYQIVIHGRDDMSLAPDDYAGFTMTLLRLHAFRPERPQALGGGVAAPGGGGRARDLPDAGRAAMPVVTAPPAPNSAAAPDTTSAAVMKSVPPWEVAQTAAIVADVATPPGTAATDEMHLPAAELEAELASGDWHAVLRRLELGGMVRELAQHCEWAGQDGDRLVLRLSRNHRHLLEMNPGLTTRIADALAICFGRAFRVHVETGEIAGATPAQRDAAERQVRHAEAVASLEADPFVRELKDRFDARLVEASVKPL
jgi:DNA polymerase-3 subunit gamma/tau